jgi:hypothetical protein
MEEPIRNKGTGAGGANTNLNGKTFEEKTSNYERLLANGFVTKRIPGKTGKFDCYLEKSIGEDATMTYLSQGGLKSYFAHFFNKHMVRCPDEAYLIRKGSNYTLRILEKKNQNVEGSADQKLGLGHAMCFEYQECLDENFEVQYAFCISNFLKQKYTSDERKYVIMRKYNTKYNIPVFFGDDEDYFTHLDEWIDS